MVQEIDKVLIHIGYHKTATTWLQAKLFTSESMVFEPLSREGSGKSTLAIKFFVDDEENLLSPFDDNAERIRSELEDLIDGNDRFQSKIPVLTHERLSGNAHSGGFDAKKIARMLKSTFPQGKVMIVIREQRSFMLSMYFQYLYRQGTHSLEKYLSLKYDNARPGFEFSHVNYLPLVKEYCNLFGKENVLVLPYEMFREDPSAYIARLGRFLEAEILVDSKEFLEVLNDKQSQYVMYHLRGLGIFRRSTSLNNYSPFAGGLSRKIVKRVVELAMLLVPKRCDAILLEKLKLKIHRLVGDEYVESNKKLSELIEIDLSGYGYS